MFQWCQQKVDVKSIKGDHKGILFEESGDKIAAIINEIAKGN
jgi:hypothetical protein